MPRASALSRAASGCGSCKGRYGGRGSDCRGTATCACYSLCPSWRLGSATRRQVAQSCPQIGRWVERCILGVSCERNHADRTIAKTQGAPSDPSHGVVSRTGGAKLEMSLNGHVTWLRLASRTRILAAALCSLLIVSFPAPGQCDEATEQAEPSADWEVNGTLYFWVSAVDGTVRADGAKSDVDLSFGDVIDQTDFSFMGALSFTYQRRWFIVLELIVADISDDETTGRNSCARSAPKV